MDSESVAGYSFYLNVIVISSNGPGGVGFDTPVKGEGKTPTPSPQVTDPTSDTDNAPSAEIDEKEPASLPPPASAESEPEPEPEPAACDNHSTPAKNEVVVSQARAENDLKKKFVGKALSSMQSSWAKRSSSFNYSGNTHEDSKRIIGSIGKSIGSSVQTMSSNVTHMGSNVSKGVSGFVSSKTMVSRAEKAVNEVIPLINEEIGVEMSISKRFQQGPVFVLEVDMKGCNLLDLLEQSLGEEPSLQYRNIVDGLEVLELTSTKAELEKEILPKVRKGLMQRMSELVPQKIRTFDKTSDLEIQCIALEDSEEAKWLYNFLEFMEQMKK